MSPFRFRKVKTPLIPWYNILDHLKLGKHKTFFQSLPPNICKQSIIGKNELSPEHPEILVRLSSKLNCKMYQKWNKWAKIIVKIAPQNQLLTDSNNNSIMGGMYWVVNYVPEAVLSSIYMIITFKSHKNFMK